MIGLAHRILVALHARGFHPAVLAGLVMMPAVVAVGFWTGEEQRAADLPSLTALRGTLVDAAIPDRGGRERNEAVPTALPLE